MEDFNIDNTSNEDLRRILANLESTRGQAKEIQSSAESDREKQRKVARLIVLLNKILVELNTVTNTLTKLRNHCSQQHNFKMVAEINHKLETVRNLTLKIQTAKLNLNYHFI